jgi:NAD-dependent deacetylase
MNRGVRMQQSIRLLRNLILNSRKIAVLTGAGISTESGIPDFRSEKGVWQDETLMAAMSDWFLKTKPEQFWPLYKRGFMAPEYLNAAPNDAHVALARLEQQGKDVVIMTQNIDGLHQRAGNTHVLELHGNMRAAECPVCHSQYELDYIQSQDVPHCSWINQKGSECGFILHPQTVLFGQNVRFYEQAMEAVVDSDLVLVIGTSLTVDPVAQLPTYARRKRTKIVVVNLEPTYLDARADLVIHLGAGEVFRQVVSQAV